MRRAEGFLLVICTFYHFLANDFRAKRMKFIRLTWEFREDELKFFIDPFSFSFCAIFGSMSVQREGQYSSLDGKYREKKVTRLSVFFFMFAVIGANSYENCIRCSTWFEGHHLANICQPMMAAAWVTSFGRQKKKAENAVAPLLDSAFRILARRNSSSQKIIWKYGRQKRERISFTLMARIRKNFECK